MFLMYLGGNRRWVPLVAGKNKTRNQLLEPEEFVNYSTVKMICRTLKQTAQMNGREFYINECFYLRLLFGMFKTD